ncbi:MDR family MFS transporter [Actinoplanes derwentensis]|uniref:Drug resistance transporter, EmrB/QacA subfamily n=1 Tax=Actinoplanes derwentensis TaxID=113562 RepID=A0A1H1Y4Z4_9ACTN|nr:MDR family MFS transporter [Actinoplanes derwentensis]GID86721.1 EmrB/QacA family drug resistance transporter [Actinoplanes derwentensis]SDT16520.1 drug resistance transporter, EmrB/QacA subfamily [Actinoplanes derwentensis]
MTDTAAPSRRQILEALTGLLLALFVSTLASTVVATALPRMLSDLHGSATDYTWVVTATLLAATAATPIWGKLADLYSKKTLLQLAAVVFIAGSIAAGFAQNSGQLIAARALQGIGVGGLQPLVQIAIGAMIPPRERGKYAGYQSSVTAISTIGGPLLGGLIVDTGWLGWRWCFFIGIPFALIAMVLLQLTLKLPVLRRDNVKIDYWGSTLITGGVSLLLTWVSFVGDAFAWASWQTLVMVGGTLILLVAAAWVETRAAEPVVPPRILRQRTTALAILGSLAAGTAMYGAAVFLTQYFQVSRGRTPTEAGLLTIPMMVGILLSSIITGRLISKHGTIKPYLVIGSTSLTAGFVILGFVDAHTSLILIGVAMTLIGAGVGMTLQNFVLVVQNAVPLSDIGAASATVSFFRSLGGTIGVAVLGAVLARQVATHTTASVPAATAYGDATGLVFAISAGVALLGVLAAVLLEPVRLRTALDLPTPTVEKRS